MKHTTLAFFTAALFSLICLPRVDAIQKGTEAKPQKSNLKPGDYVWNPQASPTGPVIIVVSLAEQKLYVFRDGVSIGGSTVSSGRAGWLTPPGLYTILKKDVVHHSNAFHEASMPYSERLTWAGLAIHGGNVPGHPESHGCIHVPLDFAKKLYTITKIGETALVTNTKAPAPGITSDPSLLLAGDANQAPPPPPPDAGQAASPAPGQTPPGPPPFSWNPQVSSTGIVSLIFSSADKTLYVARGGIEIGRAAIGGPNAGQPYGNYAFCALTQTNPDGSRQWFAVGSLDGSPPPNFQQLAQGLSIPPGFVAKARTIVGPGTTLILTDHPVKSTPRDGFNTLTTDL